MNVEPVKVDRMAASASRLWRRFVSDVAANLRFFTRLPAPGSVSAPDWAHIGWAAPFAGAIVGAIGALALGVARELALPVWIEAAMAVAALAIVTGGLHEDGLADVADGFGGGRDRETKLAIMRDSRIGTYGSLALNLGIFLRIAAIAAMLRPGPSGPGFAFAGLVLASATARATALAPLVWLAPARADGVGAAAGRLDPSVLFAAAASLAAVAFVTGLYALDVTRALFACVVAAAAVWGFTRIARRQIGGQTGDVAGAAAMIGEIAALCALLIGGRGA